MGALIATPLMAVTANSVLAAPAGAPGVLALNGNPVGNAGFNLYVEGNADLSSGETEGAIAVGGNLTTHGNYQVAPSAAATVGGNTNIGLYVGGKFDFGGSNNGLVSVQSGRSAIVQDMSNGDVLQNGQIFHFVADGVTQTGATPQLQVKEGGTFTSGTLDVAGLFSQFRSTSTGLATLTSDCTNVVEAFFKNNSNEPIKSVPATLTDATLVVTPGSINVLNVSLELLAKLQNVNNQTFDSNTTLIINVTTATTATFNPTSWPAFQNTDRTGLLWNFPNATTLNLTGGTQLNGSLFAPFAAINYSNGQNIEGTVVAKSFVHAAGAGGELHPTYRFNRSISCTPKTTTTTSTSTTTAATTTTVKPVGATTTTVKPVEVTTTTVKPVEVTTTTVKPVEVTTTTVKPVEVTTTTVKPVEVTTTTVKPVEVTTTTVESGGPTVPSTTVTPTTAAASTTTESPTTTPAAVDQGGPVPPAASVDVASEAPSIPTIAGSVLPSTGSDTSSSVHLAMYAFLAGCALLMMVRISRRRAS